MELVYNVNWGNLEQQVIWEQSSQNQCQPQATSIIFLNYIEFVSMKGEFDIEKYGLAN